MPLGLAGVGAITLPAGGSGVTASALSIALLLCATASSATASFWYPRLPHPADGLAVTAAQMLFAGAVLTAAGLATGESAHLDPRTIPASSVWALRVWRTLNNPRHAGAFAYGRRREAMAANYRRAPDRSARRRRFSRCPGGTASVGATTDFACLRSRSSCGLPQRVWSVEVIVTGSS